MFMFQLTLIFCTLTQLLHQLSCVVLVKKEKHLVEVRGGPQGTEFKLIKEELPV